MAILLGCIADDFTGATDLANTLARGGMRVVQTIGVPLAPVEGVDAVVVALKSRTAPVAEAVAQSLAAARWLREQGAVQLYFKVCSTFDSTPAGNIGPVAEALMDLLDAGIVPVTPAFPENGRTVFKGHLFVGDLLLSDSSMRKHPLTPMRDSNLVRVLQAQLHGGKARQVGLLDRARVTRGSAVIAAELASLQRGGKSLVVVDAIDDEDLRQLAAAALGLPLVVAGSGLAIGIPPLHGFSATQCPRLPAAHGARAIISGSCSAATNAQVAAFQAAGGAAYAIDPLLCATSDVVPQALAWAEPLLGQAPVLVFATAPPETVAAVQRQLGVERAGALVEATLSRIACGLVERGVGQLVVAGGETSGACVQALGIAQLRIGVQIDPGVPWCHAAQAAGGRGLHIALKSGNFGTVDFFSKAFGVLESAA